MIKNTFSDAVSAQPERMTGEQFIEYLKANPDAAKIEMPWGKASPFSNPELAPMMFGYLAPLLKGVSAEVENMSNIETLPREFEKAIYQALVFSTFDIGFDSMPVSADHQGDFLNQFQRTLTRLDEDVSASEDILFMGIDRADINSLKQRIEELKRDGEISQEDHIDFMKAAAEVREQGGPGENVKRAAEYFVRQQNVNDPDGDRAIAMAQHVEHASEMIMGFMASEGRPVPSNAVPEPRNGN